jgi:GNAT superfamily N-acetyltransferase
MDIRAVTGAELEAARARLEAEWGDPILIRGTAFRFADCEILADGAMAGLAAYSRRDQPIAELVALNAFIQRRGVGTLLLSACVARLGRDFHTLRLTTTNDNVDALRFYQKRDFVLSALRTGAVDEARLLKPSIPRLGQYGIPIRDELDLRLSIKT